VQNLSVENNGNENFSIYPNPSDGIIYIHFTGGEDALRTLEIFDATGRVVETHSFTSSAGGDVPVSVSLAGGWYYGKVTTMKGKTFSERILIVK
jgi:hypothetical protein